MTKNNSPARYWVLFNVIKRPMGALLLDLRSTLRQTE